jgi:hypothetical protein
MCATAHAPCLGIELSHPGEAAKADWRAGRFGKVPGDETEFIPLPEDSPPPADYP